MVSLGLSPEQSKCCTGQSGASLRTPLSHLLLSNNNNGDDVATREQQQQEEEQEQEQELELEQDEEQEQEQGQEQEQEQEQEQDLGEIEQHIMCYDNGHVVDFVYHSGDELRSS